MSTASLPSNASIAKTVCPAEREIICRKFLKWVMGIIAIGWMGHLAVLLWALHEFTPVESLVAIHAHMFAHGEGMYHDLNRYPLTVAAYGPIFYAISGYLGRLGVPALQSGRLISFAALGTAIWLCWRALGLLTHDKRARLSGVILAGSTANVLYWGTVGQVDMLAVCFSLAAFTSFLKYREGRSAGRLILPGILVVLAIFTKQTAMAGFGAIALTLACDGLQANPKKLGVAVAWVAGVIAAVLGIAAALNAVTQGSFFSNAILANVNPFSWMKFGQHANYLALTGTGVILTAVLGLRRVSRQTLPVYLLAGFSILMWLTTAPKIGSDLNYQIELMLVLSMCAGCSLEALEFFPSVFESRRTWVTLLTMPLLVHVALNSVLTFRVVGERALFEPVRRKEADALRPFVTRPGRLISVHYDSTLHERGTIEVDPFFYSELLQAKLVNPEPLLRDLINREFQTLILNEDISKTSNAPDPELPHFTAAQTRAILDNYTPVQRVDGPYGVYVYEPKKD